MGGDRSGDPTARNFLVICADELRPDALGCAGHPIVETPHIDALARRGTRFTRAYTPSPICVSARAALACGDYVHRVRCWDSATPYDGSRRSWMHALRDRGMKVASVGKLHFRSGDDDNGFSEEILPMHVVGGVGWAIGLLRETRPFFDGGRELAAGVGIGGSTYTEYDAEVCQAAERWIGDRAGEAGPWSAFVSFVSPHFPLTAPKAFGERYDWRNMDRPVCYAAKTGLQHPELRAIAEFYDYGRHFDDDTVLKARAAYFGLVTFLDDCVGRLVRALERSGQLEDTVILFTADHGEMLGDLGLWTKMVMYEQSAGIPMILAGPGVPENRAVATAVSLVDVAPSALAATGVHDETAWRTGPGASLLALANEPDDPDRTAFSEYHDGGSTTGSFMVRWDRWKYVHYVGYQPQLFDLEADPTEQHDLVGLSALTSESAAALAEGERRLRAICDPDRVNTQCFEDQKHRIDALGGERACRDAYVFNHTPTPAEQRSLAGEL